MNKNKNRLTRKLIIQAVVIAIMLTLLLLLYLIENLAARPLPPNLYYKENSSETYLSMLYKLRVFQDEIKEKNIVEVQLTQEEIRAYISQDKEFIRKYSIESFFIEDDNIEVIVNNKIKGKIYELWFSFHLKAKEGKIILSVSRAKVGKLPLPTRLAQYIADKMMDSVKPGVFFDDVLVNGGKISIIAKKE